MLRRFLGLALLLIVAAAPLWHLRIIDRDMPSSHNDLVGRLIGTRAALHGRDPYSVEVTRDIQTAYYGRPLAVGEDMDPQEFAYPAYLVIFLAPLAAVPWHTARLIFLWLLSPLLAGSFVLCAPFLNVPLTARRTSLIVFLSFFSWPVMWGLRLQQLTLPVAALVFTACFLLTRGRGALAGILLAMAMIKPQLILPLLAWLLVWAFLQRLWSFLASFTLTFALLLFLTEKIMPHWLSHWRKDIHGYGPHTALPLQNVFGHWLGLTATAALVAYSALLLWRLRRCPPRSAQFGLAVGLTLATTVCATLTKLPVIYNQILLLPACLILVQTRASDYYRGLARRIALAILLWGYAAIYVAVLCESIFGPSTLWDALPFQNALFPVVLAVALALIVPASLLPAWRPLPSEFAQGTAA